MSEDRSRAVAGLTAVDVVIVNFNGGTALTEAVVAVRDAAARRVVVVDNASTDGSLERFEKQDSDAAVVRERSNLGYGAAANAGVAICDAPYVLIMNPDVEVAKDALRALEAVLDAERASALSVRASSTLMGRRIPLPDGFRASDLARHMRWSGCSGHGTGGPFATATTINGQAALAARDADWVSGACVLVRKVAFDSVEGFDEAYFMYVEDLDLCWRMHRAGWRVRYEPGAIATHAQGLSTRVQPYKMLLVHHRSTWRFAVKSMTGPRRALLVFVGVGLFVRAIAALGKAAVDESRLRRS